MAGTIAGDDTILLVCRGNHAAAAIEAPVQRNGQELGPTGRWHASFSHIQAARTVRLRLPRSRNVRGVEVVTLTLDLGQGTDLETVRQQARACGAVRAHVIDAREEFARDVLVPSLMAGALADGRCPLVAALARPSIAARLAAVAAIERTSEVAHGGALSAFPRPAFDVLLRASFRRDRDRARLGR